MIYICGIIGFNWEDKEMAKKMADTIKHRGPDGEGYYTDKNISLGNRRLSIIDIQGGNQPIFNEDKSMVIVYNGELFNYLELKNKLTKHRFYTKTDTEVIIHAYEEWGKDCVKQFNGEFAFAIWDSNKKELFIVRDRAGIKPLYYYWKDGKFIFSSEMKSILLHNIEKKINRNALSQFLSYRCNDLEETIIHNIYKLLPGHSLVLKDNKIHLEKYWNLYFDETNISESEASKKVYDLLKDSVNIRLMSEVPLGVYLSGGIDSGSIVALMNNLGIKDIKTFSVGFENEKHSELRQAKEIAEHFGTDHKEILVTPDLFKVFPKIVYHGDEPMADPTAIPVYMLSEKAKKDVTVILTGEGSDEVFGGYPSYRFMALRKKLNWIPFKPLARPIIRLTPKPILNKFFKYTSQLGDKGVDRALDWLTLKDPDEQYRNLGGVFNNPEKQELGMPTSPISETPFFNSNPNSPTAFLSKRLHHNELNELLLFDFNTTLTDNLLMKVDKNTMAWGIEGRVPFLDYRLVEYASKLPQKFKMNRKTEKYILRKAMNGKIPSQTLNRKKEYFFVPIDSWLSKDLKDYSHQLLTRENLKEFNYSYIKKMFNGFEKSKLFYARQMWALMTWVLWKQQYLESFK